jgi:hypothetical protein
MTGKEVILDYLRNVLVRIISSSPELMLVKPWFMGVD